MNDKPLPEWAREVLLQVGFTREELGMPPRPAPSRPVPVRRAA